MRDLTRPFTCATCGAHKPFPDTPCVTFDERRCLYTTSCADPRCVPSGPCTCGQTLRFNPAAGEHHHLEVAA